MKKVIGTGLTGLVGSRIIELLKEKFYFENISRAEGINILDKDSLLEKVKASEAEVLIHLAAKTDVDACEDDKVRDVKFLQNKEKKIAENDLKTLESAWAINVIGTQNVVDVCQDTGKRLIFISTDFVFDGKKSSPYTEEDVASPINWYGMTKFEAEKKVSLSNIQWTILRISYPFRSSFNKKDFVRAIKEKLENREKINVVNDHVITPTFIDDLSQVFGYFIENFTPGIYNATGNTYLTPFQIANHISETFGLDKSLISGISGKDFFRGRAMRPFHLAMENDKIIKLGIKMKGFVEGLTELKNQL